MTGARSAGRLVGALVLAQMLGGVLVNFVLTAPLFGSPGFLVSASAHPSQIALSALCGIALGVMSVVIAVTVLAVARDSAWHLAVVLLALATASLATIVVEQMNVISMLYLSESYAKAPIAEQAGFQGLRLVVAAARNSSHYIGLIVGGLVLLVFYFTMYWTRLVPRTLATFGIAAASLQIVAVAMPLFGHSIVFPMLAPLGLSQLVLGLWLITKGFADLTNVRSRGDA